MRPRPPSSPLFPYTTLFRSAIRTPTDKPNVERAFHTIKTRFVEHLPGDRKSTRLNSSHVAISYAVFCLKKKRGLGAEEGHNSLTTKPSLQSRSVLRRRASRR